MSARLDRFLARAIRASMIVDTAARRFDQARSALVTRLASSSVLDAYNDLAYEETAVYRAGAPQFRETLFDWERRAIGEGFPGPPGRVLVGGAGGGREAFALAGRGYEVVAFEPSPALARSMVDHAPAGVHVEALVGRYEDLPMLTSAPTGASVDIRGFAPFQAAVFGWTSFSHLRTPAARVAALRAVGDLTKGPVLLSFYIRRQRLTESTGLMHTLARTLGLRFQGDLFTPFVGFYHLSDWAELEDEIRQAGLEIVRASFDELDGSWPYLVVQSVSAAGQKPLTSSRQESIVPRSGESART